MCQPALHTMDLFDPALVHQVLAQTRSMIREQAGAVPLTQRWMVRSLF
jgi:hypothetical protein